MMFSNSYMQSFASAFFEELGRNTAKAIQTGEITKANNLCDLARHMTIDLYKKMENEDMRRGVAMASALSDEWVKGHSTNMKNLNNSWRGNE